MPQTGVNRETLARRRPARGAARRHAHRRRSGESTVIALQKRANSAVFPVFCPILDMLPVD
jgi:hypothetical protein